MEQNLSRYQKCLEYQKQNKMMMALFQSKQRHKFFVIVSNANEYYTLIEEYRKPIRQ